MAYQASQPVSTFRGDPHETRHALIGLLAVFLGVVVGVLILVAVWMGDSHTAQQQAKAAADRAAAATSGSMAGMPGMPGMAGSGRATAETPSFTGAAPASADALAVTHSAYPAELPAAPAGAVVTVNLGINHDVLQIAPFVSH